MSVMPMDLIPEIFLHLPTKTLLRFNLIAKPYRAIINGKDFSQAHLRRSNQLRINRVILLKGALHLYLVELDSPNPIAYGVDHPLEYGGPAEVFGSSNGLIGLSNSEFNLALFNIMTRKTHRLPVEQIDYPKGCCHRGYVFYGFGYDSVNDDYKVLRMIQFNRDQEDQLGCRFPYEVKLYSLSSNSWKTIRNVPREIQFLFFFYYHLLFRRGYGVLAGNSLHWVMPRRPLYPNRNAIFGFDLATEEFRRLPEPDYGTGDFEIDLGVLEDSLCVMCNYDKTYVDVWIMKEYGVKESWTKLFKVQRPKTVSCFSFLRPLTYSKDRDKVLLEMNNEKLVWFDLASKKLNTYRVKDSPDSFSAEITVGSLVSVGEWDEQDRKHEEAVKESEEKRKTIDKGRDDFLSQGFKLRL